MRGLVDVDFDVLGVLLQEEREKEASKACTAVHARQVSYTIREHRSGQSHVHDRDAELGRAVGGQIV